MDKSKDVHINQNYQVLFYINWSIDFVVSSDPIEILRIQMHFKNGNIT